MAQKTKLVNLALQGGGAHGAFTWGALDRILEDGRLQIAGISGTSAGAMNAVALADGFTREGPEGARAALDHFWRAMSDGAKHSPVNVHSKLTRCDHPKMTHPGGGKAHRRAATK
ncbi:patatin-like phospholipase family protein, partial [Roseovarius sp. D22-M7]|uniref:patatin-like phospholipase family protein n=1 Tax=Roseovarius sp. D22-M7 TaxID=3127116 RepID=UPI00300FE970